MQTLKAPQGCNEVAHGDDSYPVVNGIVSVPEHVAHELLTKGSHGFAKLAAPPQQEARKILALKK